MSASSSSAMSRAALSSLARMPFTLWQLHDRRRSEAPESGMPPGLPCGHHERGRRKRPHPVDDPAPAPVGQLQTYEDVDSRTARTTATTC